VERWDLADASPGFDTRLEQAARELGLRVQRFPLRSLPAKVHWHFGVQGAKGTLEATWLIDSERAWLSVHANRRGDWVDAAAKSLIERLGH